MSKKSTVIKRTGTKNLERLYEAVKWFRLLVNRRPNILHIDLDIKAFPPASSGLSPDLCVSYGHVRGQAD
jgi:hypothetical protein